MHNLKQANWDFSTYLAEFLHLTLNTEYDDNTKLAALREGLSHELCALLLPFSMNQTTLMTMWNFFRSLIVNSKWKSSEQRHMLPIPQPQSPLSALPVSTLVMPTIHCLWSMLPVLRLLSLQPSPWLALILNLWTYLLTASLSLAKKKKTVGTVKGYVNTVKVLDTLQESVSILVSQGQCMWLSSTHLPALTRSRKTHSLWDKSLSET